MWQIPKTSTGYMAHYQIGDDEALVIDFMPPGRPSALEPDLSHLLANEIAALPDRSLSA